MKKLLTAVLALTAATTFAANENMVRFYGWDAGNRAQSVDLSLGGNDLEDSEDVHQNIALNYARAFGQWQVGLTYKSMTNTTDGDSSASITADEGVSYDNGSTIGLSGYYNMESDLGNTCYFALHYNMTTLTADSLTLPTTTENDDTDATFTEIVLEYGHRWTVGSAWGMNLTYAPSVQYAMGTYSFDADGVDDIATTDLSWNFLKFDVLF